jgi:hypothetical protein
MKSLKAILQNFDSSIAFNFGNWEIKLPEKCIHAQQTLGNIFDNATAKEPEEYELEESFAIVHSEWKENSSLTNVERRHIKRLPWLMFYRAQEESSILSDDGLFLEHVFNDSKYFCLSSRITALLNEFFRVYPQRNRQFWFNSLQKLLQESNSPRLWNYEKKIETYSLLSSQGPKIFAEAMYSKLETENIIKDQWFIKCLDHTNFLNEATSCLLANVYSGLANFSISAKQLCAICNYLCPNRSKFRFENLKGLIAESLLLPFKNSVPSVEVKEQIKQFLLYHYDNPYIRPGNWTKVSTDAQNILTSWFTEETLEDFFNILDFTAGPQWQYRRDFWNAVLEKKLIRKAWVILGSRARKLASRLPQRARRHGLLSGASSDQSAILMEIGSFTVCEWSHGGKCRFWFFNNQSAPILFKDEYDSASLRSRAYADFTHYSSDNCKWQSEIANFMQRELGAKLSRSDYFKGRY